MGNGHWTWDTRRWIADVYFVRRLCGVASRWRGRGEFICDLEKISVLPVQRGEQESVGGGWIPRRREKKKRIRNKLGKARLTPNSWKDHGIEE
jgi:hypothetical protein